MSREKISSGGVHSGGVDASVTVINGSTAILAKKESILPISNSFAGFLELNQGIVGGFIAASRGLKQKEEEWKTTSIFDELAKEGVAIKFSIQIPTDAVLYRLALSRGKKPPKKHTPAGREDLIRRDVVRIILNTSQAEQKDALEKIGLNPNHE